MQAGPARPRPNEVTFNTVLSACCNGAQHDRALELLTQLLHGALGCRRYLFLNSLLNLMNRWALGLHGLEGCAFLNVHGEAQIVTRAQPDPMPLKQSTLLPSQRFTFYDQVHTTGMDIKQALDATAVCTLGKDMTLRDHAQGVYRMRGLGRGQTIIVLVVDEVRELIRTDPRVRAVATLRCWPPDRRRTGSDAFSSMPSLRIAS